MVALLLVVGNYESVGESVKEYRRRGGTDGPATSLFGVGVLRPRAAALRRRKVWGAGGYLNSRFS
jgi:hypothetical protein